MDVIAANCLHRGGLYSGANPGVRPLEDYVEEFLYLSHHVPWNDNTLKSCFWSGLDDHLLMVMQAGNSICTLQQYIDYALWLVGPTQGLSTQRTSSHRSPTSVQPQPPRTINQSPPLTWSLCPPQIQSKCQRPSLSWSPSPPWSLTRCESWQKHSSWMVR